MTYGIHSTDYLRRARRRLDQRDQEGLVYAALEIRNGVEARIQEYLEPQPHIAEKEKRAYRLKVLGRAVAKVSPAEEHVTRITLVTADGEYLGNLYFTPVTSRLRDLASQCGDMLHAPLETRPTEWWLDCRGMLEEAWELLRRATLGQLLGTPLLNQEDGTTVMNIALPPGMTVTAESFKGRRFSFKVEYLKTFPDELLDADAGSHESVANDDS